MPEEVRVDTTETAWGPDEAYVGLDPAVPGIRALFTYRPDTAVPLRALAQTILRGPSPISEGHREVIAAYVSALNVCHFCASSHGGAAAALLDDRDVVAAALAGEPIPVDDKLSALLAVAAAVQRGGRFLDPAIVAQAREFGVTETELHDTVLIAAAFSMYNRYVDGLRPHVPTDAAVYEQMGERLAATGYAG
jgi:uncharacterized peroxidase-related enzyme